MRIFPATRCACSTSLRLRQEHVFCVNRHATHTLSISGVFLSFHNSVVAWKIAIRSHEKSLSQTSAEIGPGILILTSQRSCSGCRPVLNEIPSSWIVCLQRYFSLEACRRSYRDVWGSYSCRYRLAPPHNRCHRLLWTYPHQESWFPSQSKHWHNRNTRGTEMCHSSCMLDCVLCDLGGTTSRGH